MSNNHYNNIINQRTDRVIIETNKVLKNTYLLLSLTLIFSALTAAFSIAASVPAMNPARDFTKLGSFLGVGSLVCLVAIIVNLFLQMPAIHLALSLMIAFISGGLILWQTNQIIQGGEKNYITARVTLYVSILNIFLTILQFLAMFAGRRD